MFRPEDPSSKFAVQHQKSNFEVGLKTSIFEVGTSLGSRPSGPRWEAATANVDCFGRKTGVRSLTERQ